MNKKLLLISNSTLYGGGYLDHCEDEIKDFLGAEIKKIAFVPFARPSGISFDEYTKRARERYADFGYDIVSVHEDASPYQLISTADAVFIGGGNTFLLLKTLHEWDLLNGIRKRVENGMPYIGTSAGSNVACPTIKTTNDMPIVGPKNLEALGVFPYQINAHYIDPQPDSKHMGESRETRLKEYLVFNKIPVIGLREGCMIRCDGDQFLIKGTTNARIFKNINEQYEVTPVSKIEL